MELNINIKPNPFKDMTDEQLKNCYIEHIRMIKEKDRNFVYELSQKAYEFYLHWAIEEKIAEHFMEADMFSTIAHRWFKIVQDGCYFENE